MPLDLSCHLEGPCSSAPDVKENKSPSKATVVSCKGSRDSSSAQPSPTLVALSPSCHQCSTRLWVCTGMTGPRDSTNEGRNDSTSQCQWLIYILTCFYKIVVGNMCTTTPTKFCGFNQTWLSGQFSVCGLLGKTWTMSANHVLARSRPQSHRIWESRCLFLYQQIWELYKLWWFQNSHWFNPL